jgi:hypothetical protein
MSNVLDFMLPVRLKEEKLVATASQTIFTLSSIVIPNSDPERCAIYIRGTKQPSDVFSVDSPTQITFSEGLEAGDIVEVLVPSFK